MYPDLAKPEQDWHVLYTAKEKKIKNTAASKRLTILRVFLLVTNTFWVIRGKILKITWRETKIASS